MFVVHSVCGKSFHPAINAIVCSVRAIPLLSFFLVGPQKLMKVLKPESNVFQGVKSLKSSRTTSSW